MKDGKLGVVAFFVLLGVVVIIFAAMMRPFFIALAVAAIFAGLFYPLYEWIRRAIWSNETIASLVCVAVVFLVIIIPLMSVLGIFMLQIPELAKTADGWLTTVAERGPAWADNVRNDARFGKLSLDKIDWRARALDAVETASTFGLRLFQRTSKGAVQTIVMMFIMLYSLFFFFIDGPRLLVKIKRLSPLRDEYEDQIIAKFMSTTRAILKGTVLVALIQGALGGLMFAAFGIKGWAFWGTLMVITSLIPYLGAFVVWFPAVVIKLAGGHPGVAVGIAVSGICISTFDNLIRPRLIGRDTRIHPLLILFSTLGGVGLFGVAGFVLGPVLAALFLSLLDIFRIEYGEHLHDVRPGNGASPAQGPPLRAGEIAMPTGF